MSVLKLTNGNLINVEHIAAVRRVMDYGVPMTYVYLTGGTKIAISSKEREVIESILEKKSGRIIDVRDLANEEPN